MADNQHFDSLKIYQYLKKLFGKITQGVVKKDFSWNKLRARQRKIPPFERDFCTTYGIRTRDSSVKGRRLNPLTNAAENLILVLGRQR